MNSKIHRILKVNKQINFGENYWINTKFNLKTKFIWGKKKHAIISGMSWHNVLWGACWDSCVNDNISGTFVDFRLKISTQERTDAYDDLCL